MRRTARSASRALRDIVRRLGQSGQEKQHGNDKCDDDTTRGLLRYRYGKESLLGLRDKKGVLRSLQRNPAGSGEYY